MKLLKLAALALLTVLFVTAPAYSCDRFTRKYATATTVNTCLWKTDGTGLKSDFACEGSGTDVKLMLDEAAESNPTNCFVDEGQCYSLALTSGEMTAARVLVILNDDDDAVLDKCLIIETFGNASATFGIADTNVTQWSGTAVAAVDTAGYPKVTIKPGTGTGELALTAGVVNADMIKISTDAAAADTLELAYDGTGYAGGTIKQGVDIVSLQNGVITAAKFGSGAINAASVNTDLKGATYNSSTDTLENIRDNTSLTVSLQSGSVDAATITTAAANKIADHTLRRTTANVEASGDGDTLGFKSLYGAAAKQVHSIAVAGSTLTVKKADGSTTLDTQTVTTSSGAAPITGISTN